MQEKTQLKNKKRSYNSKNKENNNKFSNNNKRVKKWKLKNNNKIF